MSANQSIFHNVLSPIDRKKMKFVGINKLMKPTRTHFTGLERKYYLMLKNLNVFYITQFRLEGRYYDAFLPDQGLLIEFDGSFWHKEKEEDCKYDFQRKGMEVDKLKNKIAKDKGFKLIRIKENEPITQDQLKKLIWD